MSALSDEYIKNFSKERKSIFNKRFRDEYDPNMSERSNIIRILNEMRELGLADGGRIGLNEGLGSFETNNPKDAVKEIIKKYVEKGTTTFPITENIFLNLAPGVSDAELGGIMQIFGGELGFGASKDKGIGFSFKKKFNKGGRVNYQDGTEYNENVKEKLRDLATQAVGKFDEITGVDQITGFNFPKSFSGATGPPSDFRHQAASNLVAEALGKGKFGPLGYLSGGLGSFGIGTAKEIGDFVKGALDPDTTVKDAFSQAYEDTISNFKGAFAPAGTTTEELYDKILADYDLPSFDEGLFVRNLRQNVIERQKQLEDLRKKSIENLINQRDSKPTTTVTGTTKPGTAGGRDSKPTTSGFSAPTKQGQSPRGTTTKSSPRQTAREDRRGGQYGFASGGLARMLGE